MKRINFWSSPRNISTALMYSFAQRSDTKVVDEPLYAHYLVNCDRKHPGQAEIIASQHQDGERVVQDELLGHHEKPVILFKQMTHHLIAIDWTFLTKMTNVLLIRSPYEIIRSYSKVIESPTVADVGVQQQLKLYDYLTENDELTAIVDSRRLLLDPKIQLQKLCKAIEIPFEENMLSWSPGARQEDGVWAKYWYKNVHRSTGFQAYKAKEEVLSPTLNALVKECQPAYEVLLEQAL